MNNATNETNALRYCIKQLRKAYEQKDKEKVLNLLSEATVVELALVETEVINEWEALMEETGTLFK